MRVSQHFRATYVNIYVATVVAGAYTALPCQNIWALAITDSFSWTVVEFIGWAGNDLGHFFILHFHLAGLRPGAWQRRFISLQFSFGLFCFNHPKNR